MRRDVPSDLRFRAEAVAIGASAGGIDALLTVFGGLKPPLRSTFLVVLHLPEEHDSHLTGVFGTRLALPVQEAQPGALAQPGHVYFAPPGYHLLVEADRTFALSCEAPVVYSRPSIDVLMQSCADAWGPQLAGILLTGANEDGATGLAAIQAAGGLTAVQDPREAAHAAMPEAAIRLAAADFILPLAGVRTLLHTVSRP